MTTEPLIGSSRARKGFLYVSPASMRGYSEPLYSKEIERYRFHINGGNVYYINGRRQVFRLNCRAGESFYLGMFDDIYWLSLLGPLGIKEPVLFTPVTHLEYVFS